MKSFKIVADSSSDVLSLSDVDFASVPLKIITAEREFLDDKNLDVSEMVSYLSNYKGRSSTSCPNPQDWILAFGEAELVFCITITSTLSGCYNSAVIAKEIYEERHPGRKVFVLDSLSTGPEMKLIIEKVAGAYERGESFEEICRLAGEYSKTTGLFFILKSMQNLANNGRVSKIIAKAAGLLGIRVLGEASEKGDLAELDKCRGEEAALKSALSHMEKGGYAGGKVKIAHCMNADAANELKSMLLQENTGTEVEIYDCRALCSFYAESGGLLIGFEKN